MTLHLIQEYWSGLALVQVIYLEGENIVNKLNIFRRKNYVCLKDNNNNLHRNNFIFGNMGYHRIVYVAHYNIHIIYNLMRVGFVFT